MKNQHRSLLAMALPGCAVVTILFTQSTGQSQPKPTGTVRVENSVESWNPEGKALRIYAFASLIKSGNNADALRSMELANSGNNSWTYWEGLPVGNYEVHFETKGYGRVVKRIVVAADKTTTVYLSSLGENDELWGAGPSLAQLEKKINVLETKVSALEKNQK